MEVEDNESLSASQITMSNDKSTKIQPVKPNYLPDNIWKEEEQKKLTGVFKEKDLEGKDTIDSTEFYYLRLRKMFLKNYENLDRLLTTDGKDLDVTRLLVRIFNKASNKIKEASRNERRNIKRDIQSVQSVLDRHLENKRTRIANLSYENMFDHYLTNYIKKQNPKPVNASTQTVKVSSKLLNVSDHIERSRYSIEREGEKKFPNTIHEVQSEELSEPNTYYRKKSNR